jgi:hypothetical protein
MFMNGNNNGYRPQGGQTWNQHPYYQGGNQGNCDTWVPLGPHGPGSRPSPTSGFGLLERPANLSVGPTDLVGGPHDLLKTF